jgi:hypothetical protein
MKEKNMRKFLFSLIIPILLSWCSVSYGMGPWPSQAKLPVLRVIVYKGIIKANKAVIDVNDVNAYLPVNLQCYWAISLSNGDPNYIKSSLLNASALIYNPKTRNYKIIPSTSASTWVKPFDPCGITMLEFSTQETEGKMSFHAMGKGKLMKYTKDPLDPNHGKDYIVPAYNGSGVFLNYDLFDPNFAYAGPFTVALKLDTRWTYLCNPSADVNMLGPNAYDDISEVIDDIVYVLTNRDPNSWTQWPFTPPPATNAAPYTY